MKIGMLWGLDKLNGISEAKKYHISKYSMIPDTVEINPLFAEKIGVDVKSGSYDGMRIIISNSVTIGTIIIGLEKSDESKYLVKEK